ncbi:MAG: DUF1080 domain-containing protein [Planctomycetota bacterium]
MRRLTRHGLLACATLTLIAGGSACQETRPSAFPAPSPTLGAMPTLDDGRTVSLFNGTDMLQWHHRDGKDCQWDVRDNHSVVVQGGDAITRETFGDFQLHLEFFLPDMPDREGQAKSNSGVYIHGRYEVQVLDTFGAAPFPGGCGGIYSIAPPMVNASRPADTWQTYDIIFRAPRFDDAGNITENPHVTVIHNGVVIHNNLELPHCTPGGLDDTMVATGPILLQDHGDRVQYRNIWLRRLD